VVHYQNVLTFREFAAQVLGPISMLPVLEMPITDALGCRSAERVVADLAVPGYRAALVDGIAVVAADVAAASPATPIMLPIGGTVAAGTPAEPIEEGHCARVAAGAQLPAGTDAVISAAHCQIEDGKVSLTRGPKPGEGFRDIGSQFEAGQLVIEEGQYLGHVAIAELALIGRPRALVHPRPRVVVITVGSELVRVSSPVGDVTVHDAAGVLLTTTASRLGADCYRVGPIPDDPRAVRDAIEDQLVRADIVVTAGGIDTHSDVLHQELLKAGIARFDGPDLAPCPSYGIGRIGPDKTPIVALPGDPAIALLAFHALARPVITAMLGRDIFRRDNTVTPPRRAITGSRLVPGRFEGNHFVPVVAEPPTLADLASVTAISIHHADQDVAEVVEWPF